MIIAGSVANLSCAYAFIPLGQYVPGTAVSYDGIPPIADDDARLKTQERHDCKKRDNAEWFCLSRRRHTSAAQSFLVRASAAAITSSMS